MIKRIPIAGNPPVKDLAGLRCIDTCALCNSFELYGDSAQVYRSDQKGYDKRTKSEQNPQQGEAVLDQNEPNSGNQNCNSRRHQNTQANIRQQLSEVSHQTDIPALPSSDTHNEEQRCSAKPDDGP